MQIFKRLKVNQLVVVTVTYAVVLLAFRHFDLAIFTEIGIYVEKVKFQSRSTLTDSEYFRAFHLDDKYRNDESNVILHWSPAFGHVIPIGNMENDGCVQTFDRTAISVAKAVVFHFAELQNDPYWLPLHQRRPSQRWVWFCQEPPTLTSKIFHKSLTSLNGIFNWTMTYRTDSDILTTYRQSIATTNRSVEDMLQNKQSSGIGIWMVSNCKSTFRNKLIQELQQYIKIDVKGQCTGDILCRGTCATKAVSSYKFVFTLENSRCKDYITEKFFNWGLNTEAVPVVLGPSRSSYEKYASAKSFIHIEDFESIESLGKYLRHLTNNDRDYAEFLKYKSALYPEFHRHPPGRPVTGNLLCNMIKDSTKPEKVVHDLDTWWYGKQYSAKNSEASMSLCKMEDGTSGKDYHSTFVFWYHFGIVLMYIITCAIVAKLGDDDCVAGRTVAVP